MRETLTKWKCSYKVSGSLKMIWWRLDRVFGNLVFRDYDEAEFSENSPKQEKNRVCSKKTKTIFLGKKEISAFLLFSVKVCFGVCDKTLMYKSWRRRRRCRRRVGRKLSKCFSLIQFFLLEIQFCNNFLSFPLFKPKSSKPVKKRKRNRRRSQTSKSFPPKNNLSKGSCS